MNNIPGFIQTKINQIDTDLQNDLQLKDILGKHFPELLHNRIGTPLLKSERDNLSFGITSDITPGKLVAYQKRYDEYYWGVIVEEETNGKVKVATRDFNGNITIDHNGQFVSNLTSYPSNIHVEQDKNGI